MVELLEDFKKLLASEQKEEAVDYALALIETEKTDVVGLYENILTPALNQMECKLEDRNLCIWKEHVQTAIVRTIVECCYPYVMKQRKAKSIRNGLTAVVLCPPEEYHDLGARMVTDFFTLCGYDTIFVGSNTPYQDFYQAIYSIQPDLVAISVSNYFNLVATKRIIQELRSASLKMPFIVAGGRAIDRDEHSIEIVGADERIRSFHDIQQLAERQVRS